MLTCWMSAAEGDGKLIVYQQKQAVEALSDVE